MGSSPWSGQDLPVTVTLKDRAKHNSHRALSSEVFAGQELHSMMGIVLMVSEKETIHSALLCFPLLREGLSLSLESSAHTLLSVTRGCYTKEPLEEHCG